jgi:hypothetical protein
MMTPIPTTIEIELRDYIRLEDIKENLWPLSSECNYWGRVDEAIAREGTWQWFVRSTDPDEEGDEGASAWVSYEKLLWAYGAIFAGKVRIADYIRQYFINALLRSASQVGDSSIDWGEIDGEAADVWWQVATFEELIYG